MGELPVVHPPRTPPIDMFRSSSRFWFRDKDIAFGLLQNTRTKCAFPTYWKWNRTSGKWRITPLAEDKALFSTKKNVDSLAISPDSIVSYKPESRLAWKQEYENHVFFSKLYRKRTFERACTAVEVAEACSKTFMSLKGINPGRRIIQWEWIDGNPLPDNGAFLDAVIFVTRHLHALDPNSAVALPLFAKTQIRLQIEHRIQTFQNWLDVLIPSKKSFFLSLLKRYEKLLIELNRLEESRRLCVIHGDLRRKNILKPEKGNPKLLDVDHLAIGEQEWDFAASSADFPEDDTQFIKHFLSDLVSKLNLDYERLRLYHATWRLIYDLKSMEENVE